MKLLEWWQNATRTLTEADSARLRRLDRQVQGLADDVSLLLDTLPKINDRLRMRARREKENAEGVETVPGRADAVGELEGPQLVHSPAPQGVVTKDQMRGLARAKGIRV